MKRKSILLSLAAVLAIPAAIAVGQQSNGFSFQVTGTFDYPGTGNFTRPQKINDHGDIVGVFADSSGISYGFILRAGGHFSPPLTAPGDTGGITECRGINNSRLICGDYLDGDTGNYTGFFLTGTKFTDYLVPSSSWTILLGLNDANDFCGSDVISAQDGFVSINGNVTTFDVPVATNTLAYGLNNRDQICGYYIDSDAIDHGYWREAGGVLHAPVDPSGSTQTILFGNNDRNFMVGRYVDASGITHGLVYVPPARFVVFDYPGSGFTSLNGINNNNVIVGRYMDSSGFEHGFTVQMSRAHGDSAVELPMAAPRDPAPYRPAQQSAVSHPAL